MKIEPKKVLITTCNYYGVEPNFLFKNTRKTEVIRKRQVLSFMLKKHTSLTFNQISDIYGDYNLRKPTHPTVLHNVKKIKQEYDLGYKDTVKDVDTINYMIDEAVKLESNIIPVDVDLIGLCELN